MTAKNSAHLAPDDFQKFLEIVTGMYMILDTQFNIVAVGGSYAKQTMIDPTQVIGKNLFDVFPDNPKDESPTGSKNIRASLERVLHDKLPDTMAVQKYDIRRPAAAGGTFEERYWSPVNSPILDDEGNVKYIVNQVTDVTEYMQTIKKHDALANKVSGDLRIRMNEMEMEIYLRAQEIQETNRQLREVNKLLAKKESEQAVLLNKLEKFNQSKTQFFASVSHELRTPLTLILGILETLLADHELITHQYNLKVIERNARSLLKLVNDLLDVSKLEAGKVAVNYFEIDLAKLVRQTGGLFESYASERKINFILQAPPTLRAELDAEKIQRVLMNLLSNAFKFTPVNKKVTCILSNPSVHIARLEIADGGPGPGYR